MGFSSLSSKIRPCKIATNTFAILCETWTTQSICVAFLEVQGWNNKGNRAFIFVIFTATNTFML